MSSKYLKSVVAGALLMGLWAAITSPTQAQSMRSSFINVGDRTLVPYGWMDFCNRYSNECTGQPLAASDIKLTASTFKRIAQINRWVNSNLTAVSDSDQWGVIDRWDYPSNGRGDCEDFVLLKRRLLIDEGFPRQALLVTVVKDENGDGHAVLTVKTSQGEFILDNLREGVKAWTSTPYKYVKRQSQEDPNVWVSIGEPTAAPLIVSR